MKKLIRVLLCLSLCFAVVFSFACNPQELMFNGNYDVEATDEQITELVSNVDTDKILGEENVIGASLSFEYSMDGTTTETYEEETETSHVAGTFALDAKFSVDQEKLKDEDTMAEAIKASLDLNLSVENEYSEYPEENEETTGKLGAYLDNSGLYLNLQTTTNNTDKTTKGRIDVEEIMAVLSQLIGGANIGLPSIDVNSQTLEDAFDYLKEIGCKIYIDNSNGHKIKISITEEAIINIIEGSINSYYYEVDYNFDIETADIYLAIDKDGVLKGVKFDVNVEYNVSQESYYGPSITTEGALSLNLTMFMGKVNISTPNNLSEFKNLDLEDLRIFD